MSSFSVNLSVLEHISSPMSSNNNSMKTLSNLDLNTFDETDNHIPLANSVYLTLKDVPKFIGNNLNCLNFMHINCRSLQRNFDTLSSLISQIDKQLTALAVSETWLKPNNEDAFHLPGYAFVACSRPVKVGAGVGLYINDQ